MKWLVDVNRTDRFMEIAQTVGFFLLNRTGSICQWK